MEKVQFQLESTLPELKDLHEKGLFSRHEIAEITKRRTAFETALVRRQARKDDFFKYAEYEINLEKLRKIRWKKLKYDRNPPPPSASTYSIPRRTLYILKRATAKFPGELAVWLAYVEYAAREGMTKVVAKGLNSAMQHHPLSPTLYLLQSYHHLHPGLPLPRSDIPSSSSSASPIGEDGGPKPASAFALEGTGPARTTLLLGLRLLPASHALWREYVKLELGWVEALRRRWRALGIAGSDAAYDGDAAALAGGEGSFGPEGEEARRAILSGELVLHAVSESLKKVKPDSADPVTGEDGISFRDNLLKMLRSYPSPLRSKAQAAVYADLERIAKGPAAEELKARAKLLLITRGLYDREYVAGEEKADGVVLTGVALVDAYAAIGRALKGASGPMASTAGLWLLAQLSGLDAELRAYALGLVARLTKRRAQPSPDLLLAHLAALAAYGQGGLDVFRAHAAVYPANPVLQLALANAEVDAAEARAPGAKTPGQLRAMFKDITARVAGREQEDRDATVALWAEWAHLEDDLRPLLLASLRVPIPELHSRILATHFFTLLSAGTPPADALKSVARYAPGAEFFRLGFEQLGELSGEEGAMAAFYDAWKRNARDGEVVHAALTYARWLVERRKGRDARVVVETAKRQARGHEAEIEAGWARILDEAEREDDEDLDDEIESDDEEEQEQEDSDGDVAMAEEGSEEEGEDSHESSDLEIAM